MINTKKNERHYYNNDKRFKIRQYEFFNIKMNIQKVEFEAPPENLRESRTPFFKEEDSNAILNMM